MPPKPKKSQLGNIVMGLLVIATLAMVTTAVVAEHGLLTYVEMEKRSEEMRVELDELKAENERLRNEIQALKGDPEAIERAAREELGMIKPGEVLYRIEESPDGKHEGGGP